MPQERASASCTRYHIVLIPGFGGFDALGEIEYYAGITPLFQAWKKERPVVLHYFDNYPTAAVVTRAARLQEYLAKRYVRGEILPNDVVTLVGHSTGGLDIRQLLWDLSHAAKPAANKAVKVIQVDGGACVDPRELLKCLRRVVFLSVPHWGTNIADWVVSHRELREAVIECLREGVKGSQVYLLDLMEEWVAGETARISGANLFLALQDAVTEANDHCRYVTNRRRTAQDAPSEANEDYADRGVPKLRLRYGCLSPRRTAEAHEAASDLGLYTRDMTSDFHVINDLAPYPPRRGPKSPAQFTVAQRNEELGWWAKIEVLSYVTFGHRPVRFAPGEPVSELKLLDPLREVNLLKGDGPGAGTDLPYRLCYRACAGGPLDRPQQPPIVAKRYLKGNRQRDIALQDREVPLWVNDGIVNTVSMFWSQGRTVENTLVFGDHLDIVGHYKLTPAAPGGGRQYQSYDTLKSRSGFTGKTFANVWTNIFDFGARP
jgi:hypothetical protein